MNDNAPDYAHFDVPATDSHERRVSYGIAAAVLMMILLGLALFGIASAHRLHTPPVSNPTPAELSSRVGPVD